MFSRGALEAYLSHLQDVVKSEIAKWCTETGSVDVYTAAKSLTFRIAVRVLLGLRLEEQQITSLSKTFEQLMNNLFSLPIDTPISGLRKVRMSPVLIFHQQAKSHIGSQLEQTNSISKSLDECLNFIYFEELLCMNIVCLFCCRESGPVRFCTLPWRRS